MRNHVLLEAYIALVGIELILANPENSRSYPRKSCCKPAAACASILVTAEERSKSKCQLSYVSFGLCCYERTQEDPSRFPFRSANSEGTRFRFDSSLSSESVQNDLTLQQENELLDNITSQFSSFVSPERNTGTFYHARFQRQARSETKDQGMIGLLLEELARRGLRQRSPIRSEQDAAVKDSESDVRETFGNQTCPVQVSCPYSKYRSIDGSCNNPRNSILGKTDTVLNRILLPEYSDGIALPRQSKSGRPLPSARLLSTSLATDIDRKDSRFSVVLMNFGQFIDHDLAHSPVMSGSDNEDIDCCSSRESIPSFPSFCFPIRIPFKDRFFNRTKPCMNLVRSSIGPALDCSVGYREQINQLTHWLDLSQVYGSTSKEEKELRKFKGGRLRISPGFDGPLLPGNPAVNECKEETCMLAGDSRVNEQPNLGVIHILFLREHNKIANGLSSLNPHWSDEKVFQEARKILIGKYQHIVYNEFLPIVLGEKIMKQYGLLPLSKGFSQDYDPSIDPRITNAFSSAAFRFGHSLIPGDIKPMVSNGMNKNSTIFLLRDSFFRPDLLRQPGILDGLISSLTKENIQKFDTSFTEDITNHLFAEGSRGLDLIALNVQRGRDHGIPGYTKYRELCGLGSAHSFQSLKNQINYNRINQLKHLYTDPGDIDLFVALFSENVEPGALVGPTSLCILGDQFARLKRGDRFFYDLGGQDGSFTSAQLCEVRKASLTRLLCDNSGEDRFQPLSFQSRSEDNPILSCHDLNAIKTPSLQPWKE